MSKKKKSPYIPNKDLTLILRLNPDDLTSEMKEYHKKAIPQAKDDFGRPFTLGFEMMICIPQDDKKTSFFFKVINHNYRNEFLNGLNRNAYGINRTGFIRTFELKTLTPKQKKYFLKEALKYIAVYAIQLK